MMKGRIFCLFGDGVSFLAFRGFGEWVFPGWLFYVYTIVFTSEGNESERRAFGRSNWLLADCGSSTLELSMYDHVSDVSCFTSLTRKASGLPPLRAISPDPLSTLSPPPHPLTHFRPQSWDKYTLFPYVALRGRRVLVCLQ